MSSSKTPLTGTGTKTSEDLACFVQSIVSPQYCNIYSSAMRYAVKECYDITSLLKWNGLYGGLCLTKSSQESATLRKEETRSVVFLKVFYFKAK